MKIDSIDDLRALQRALHEAKVSACPRDLDVAGSPIVAALYERVLEAMVDGYRPAGNEYKVKSADAWRKLAGHDYEIDVVVNRLAALIADRTVSSEHVHALTTDTLRPFLFSEGELAEVVARAREQAQQER